MIKNVTLAAGSALAGLLTSTQIAAAKGLEDQVGETAATIFGLGWLGFLAVLGLAIVLPLMRR